jgi:hypothetical protein
MDVGFRTIICSLDAEPAEGTDFENVTEYEVVNAINTDTGGWMASSRWRFKVDRTCVDEMVYRRFLWKNQLGGWDMFSSAGTFESRRQTKHETFQKNLGNSSGTLTDYGVNNWITTEDQVMKVTSQHMTNAEAMWFSKIVNSAFTYVRVDMKADLDGQIFANFDSYETWREAGTCNGWAMIVIRSNSVKIRKTTKRTQKVSFEYQFARRDVYPRN